MSTYSYEYIHIYHIFMITSEILNCLKFEIHEVDHQEYLTVNKNIVSH
jgi:hypothetical protein